MQNFKEQFVQDIKGMFDQLVDEQICIVEKFYSEALIRDNLEWDTQNNSVQLKEEFEYEFFKRLFSWHQPTEVFHYTSFETLFNIVRTGKLQLCALTGMNDKSEIGYVNKFMGKYSEEHYDTMVMAYHNNHFISSFSEKVDDLNQWRLYGDDGKGAAIKFRINSSCPAYKNVLISSVLYNLKEFEIIKKHLTIFQKKYPVSFGLKSINYWKFFYKDISYYDEKEARIIVNNMELKEHQTFPVSFKINRLGILIPFIEVDCIKHTSTTFLTIEEIMLGPKFIEPELNKFQVYHLIEKTYESALWNINVTHSKIRHYR